MVELINEGLNPIAGLLKTEVGFLKTWGYLKLAALAVND